MTVQPLGSQKINWAGSLSDHRQDWSAVATQLTRTLETGSTDVQAVNGYSDRFFQGSFLAPRVVFWVQRVAAGPLGAGAGRTSVRSDRSGQERAPWKGVSDRTGNVESEFVLPAIQGEHILPFGLCPPGSVVVAWYNGRLLDADDPDLDRFPGLAEWWRQSVDLWEHHRENTSTGSLNERVDYKKGFSNQFPAATIRVVYAGSGSRLTATVVTDRRIIVEKSAYWGAVSTMDEALFLAALMNSAAVDEAVKPFQARGIGGARHFDKHVFKVMWPPFEADSPSHQAVVTAAKEASSLVAAMEMPVSARTARRKARELLESSGAAADLDAAVAAVLA